MAYKILYIEDEQPESLIAQLEKDGEFKVEVWKPDNVEQIESKIGDNDLIIMDFRLDKSSSQFDGPSFAQPLRTKNSRVHKDLPIVLFSVENKIIDHFNDYTSRDLFDFAIPKEVYFDNTSKYNNRLKSLIKAYKVIAKTKDLTTVLGTTKARVETLDYRIEFYTQKEVIKGDIYAFSSFIHQNIIRSIGVLIGEDILSARLGISKDSKDWDSLMSMLEVHKYKGIFSDSYERWWADDISKWFIEMSNQKIPMRRFGAEDRCRIIKDATGLSDLDPLKKIEHAPYRAKSSKFWTICRETLLPIDPIDGFEIYERELLPWQEKEYISFMGKSGTLQKCVKPEDKKRIREIENSLKS